MRWFGLCLVASLLVVRSAQADGERQADLKPQPRHSLPVVRDTHPLLRTGAIAAALTIGLVVHGTGSYLVGEKRTARRLAVIEAIGLGGILGGGGAVGLTGGYPPTLPLLPVLLVGTGMFFTSWWADVGVAAGVPRIGVSRAASPWSLELAMLYLSDPYRQAGLARVGGNVELGRVQLGGSLLADAENELRTAEVDARVRLRGAAWNGEIADDGSRLLLRAGLRGHDDNADNLSIGTAELEVIARLDLFHIDRALRGSFVQMSTGIGVERIAYTGASANSSVLLGTFGWGLYLGNRGELQLFYDHRRDSMVGGIAAGRAAGFVGSLGASLDWLLDPRFAVHLELDVGNAWLTTLGVRYRGGLR